MAPFSIDPNTTIGATYLTVADLDRSERFYRDVLGFRELARDGDTLALSADGTRPLLVLDERPGGAPKTARPHAQYHNDKNKPTSEDHAPERRHAPPRQARSKLAIDADYYVRHSYYGADLERRATRCVRRSAARSSAR